jgi:hypothetical protein
MRGVFDGSIYGYFAIDIGVVLHHALHNAAGKKVT